jgi:hypothetical protein
VGGSGNAERPAVRKFSEDLEQWLRSERPTIGSLIDLLGPRSFGALFVVLMAVPALPVPTGGVTHVLELVAMLLALELIAGRREVWLPNRWRRLEIGGPGGGGQRFAEGLLRRVRWLERYSRTRGRVLLDNRPARALFGLAVLGLALTAFLAPPFSGLDTIPSLGVVVMSLGVLLGDLVMAVIGLTLGAAGVLIVVLLGQAVVNAIGDLF